MVKLYIEGFRGPWGWVSEYENQIIYSKSKDIKITNVEDCDVIFQCDPNNWRLNEKYLGKKFVIANVLDFAHWSGGNPDTEEYVNKFCRKANVVVAISYDVINRLKERNIHASMFYYPSQVSKQTIELTKRFSSQKKDRIISFCRLGDPGKRICESVHAFLESDLSGWEYWLIGPETPSGAPNEAINGKKVIVKGWYPQSISLFRDVAMSKATIMPSIGEGLGLPAIESILVGTQSVARNVEPMESILNNTGTLFFNDYIGLISCLNTLNYKINQINAEPVMWWTRDVSFSLFTKMILESKN